MPHFKQHLNSVCKKASQSTIQVLYPRDYISEQKWWILPPCWDWLETGNENKIMIIRVGTKYNNLQISSPFPLKLQGSFKHLKSRIVLHLDTIIRGTFLGICLTQVAVKSNLMKVIRTKTVSWLGSGTRAPIKCKCSKKVSKNLRECTLKTKLIDVQTSVEQIFPILCLTHVGQNKATVI